MKLSLIVFEIFLLFMGLNSNKGGGGGVLAARQLGTLKKYFDDDNNFANALLLVETTSLKDLVLSSRNSECNQCNLLDLAEFNYKQNASLIFDTDYPNYYLSVRNRLTNQPICAGLFSKPIHFGENGTYLLRVDNKDPFNLTSFNCSLTVLVKPNKILIPIYIALGVYFGAALIYAIGKKVYLKVKYSSTYSNRIVNADFGVPILSGSSTYILDEQELASTSRLSVKLKANRMKSVDAFRGLCLAIMIFANYGSGGYTFLDHTPWNGLHLADTVFPCFIFIMGISIPFSFKSISAKKQSREGTQIIKLKYLFYKILKRTILLFFFGLVTSNTSDIYPRNVRVFGVLQRFAISYLVCALIELIYFRLNNNMYISLNNIDPSLTWQSSKVLIIKSKFKEIFFYPIQWLLVSMLVLVWTLITFLLPVQGCQAGYLGPGGSDEGGKWFNCTGGAAGYIDRLLLGPTHMYQYPTCLKIYSNTQPHDPEGLLGCLTSCVLTYLGVSCGHIIIHYQEYAKRITRFVFYALIYGITALVLCKFSKNDGWIPINKNLWSLSYILAMASLAFLVLTILYILIDLLNVYSGVPFIYLGRNSITIYICHIVFQNYFPFFKVNSTHSYMLAYALYGVTLWTFVAALMNHKNVFINL